MPLYRFRNKKTRREWEVSMSMREREEYLAENDDVESIITRAPSIGDPIRMGITRPDESFRDRLREIKNAHHGSTIDIR